MPRTTHPMVFPMMLILFSPMGIDLFLPALGDVADSLGGSAAESQWAISAFVLALGIGQIPFGAAADAYGRRIVSLVGLCLFAAGSVLCLFANDFPTLLIGRFVQGLGASATTVCAFTMVRDQYEGDAASAKFSWLTGALNAVPSLAPAFGAVLVLSWGWRSAFAFYALIALIGLGASWSWQAETGQKSEASRPGLANFASDAIKVLKTSNSWLPGLTCIGGLSFVISYVSLAPVVLMEQLQVSPVSFSVYFGLNGFVILVFSFLVPRLNAQFGVPNLIRFGVGAIAFSAALLLILGTANAISSPWAFMLPIALGSIGFATSFGNAQGVAMEPHGALAGTAAGILGALQMMVASVVAAIVIPIDLGSGIFFGALFFAVFVMLFWGWKRSAT